MKDEQQGAQDPEAVQHGNIPRGLRALGLAAAEQLVLFEKQAGSMSISKWTGNVSMAGMPCAFSAISQTPSLTPSAAMEFQCLFGFWLLPREHPHQSTQGRTAH